MSKVNNNLKLTKTLYTCYIDRDGHLKKLPDGSIGHLRLPDEILDFLRKYIDFMINSTILNKSTWIYLQSPADSERGAIGSYVYAHPDEKMKFNTGMSNIAYVKRKMSDTFDNDMLNELIYHPKTAINKLEHYREQLSRAMEKYRKGNIFRDKLFITINPAINSDRPSEEAINDFLMDIEPYRSSIKELIEKMINDKHHEVIGYFNYLTQTSNKDDWQMEQWEKLNDFLDNKQVTYQEQEDREQENFGNELNPDDEYNGAIDDFDFDIAQPDQTDQADQIDRH